MKTLINYFKFLFFAIKSQSIYFQLRNDYMVQKSRFIDLACFFQSCFVKTYNIKKSSGFIGDLGTKKAKKIAAEISKNCYYIFQNCLNDIKLNSAVEFANSMTVEFPMVNDEQKRPINSSYMNCNKLSNRFDLKYINEINQSPELLELIVDENMLHIASEYLKTKPILDIIALWWTKPVPNFLPEAHQKILLNKSAQMFHHDLDRLKFLKFFVYLTDVDHDNGPHVYVKKTHKRSPSYINSDGRYDDSLVYKYNGSEVVSITGKRGTIIAVDTRGLHKGKEVIKGERLLFQIEFANSLFGKPDYQTGQLNLNFKPKYKFTYKLFSSRHK